MDRLVDGSRIARRHRSGSPPPSILLCRKGQPVSARIEWSSAVSDALASEVIQSALEAENIPLHGWHAFRGGLATNLRRIGVSDKVIQQILRIVNVTATMNIYVKLVSRDSEETIKTLETECAAVVL
jgi:site-specific recombinase XerD